MDEAADIHHKVQNDPGSECRPRTYHSARPMTTWSGIERSTEPREDRMHSIGKGTDAHHETSKTRLKQKKTPNAVEATTNHTRHSRSDTKSAHNTP